MVADVFETWGGAPTFLIWTTLEANVAAPGKRKVAFG